MTILKADKFFIIYVSMYHGFNLHEFVGENMNKTLSKKETLTVGLMLFALFFGAGNMIFSPALGQAAGTNVWIATFGFLITGVGLPLLEVIAVSKTNGDFTEIVIESIDRPFQA
jgi:branched-subunit amino acid permease